MSQNITIMGASYTGVPAVTLPKTGGGTARFDDATVTTATASDVASGKVFVAADGTVTTGTASGGGGSVTQDQDGYIVLPDTGGGGSSVTVEPLSVTSNGTYTAPSGTAYSPVTVNVSGGGGDIMGLVDGTATTLSLPSGLTSIRPYCFYNMANLESVSMPSGLQSIGENAFYLCRNLESAALPASVTSIGKNAFYNCVSVVLDELPSGLTSLGDGSFSGCSNAAFTSIPNGITVIPASAFYRCSNVEISSLPSGIVTIGQYAFQGCTKIRSITCDGAITGLGTYSFNGYGSTGDMSTLVSVSFPNMNVTNLSYAFGNSATPSSACQQLEVADVGTVNSIVANAFANCYKLQTLVLRKTAAVTVLANVSAFTNTPMRGYNGLTGTVYVPSALISSYQAASNWSTLYSGGTVEFRAIEGSVYEL